MKTKINNKLISIDSDGFVHEVVGDKLIPTIICDLDGNVLLGIEWCWDIIEKQQGREIQHIFIDTKVPKSAQYN